MNSSPTAAHGNPFLVTHSAAFTPPARFLLLLLLLLAEFPNDWGSSFQILVGCFCC